ncbi:hypothetical protein [Massilia sp. TS11]|uniref:hypothetical protein n=1 Tax=Massilia sp. TS11 TaxID=2908003 RepID=UPI001EDAE59A|nr:hypothetical protein [Massilia sp. TS11]MCG2586786.1 hypothetical protein [Massilia sp. TS11]
MSELFSNHLALLQSLVALVVLLAIYVTFKFRIDFWWLNFWYGLPLIGKLARLARDSSRYAKDNSWTNSERTLCTDYRQFVNLTSEAEFNRRIDYMAKAGDTGRSPTPGWLFLVLGLLIIAEGMGFSYLLGSWMAMEGSENTRLLLMAGIVFVLCVVLGFLTHQAGHQMYRTNLVRRCQKEWRDEGQKGKFRTENITLKDDQHGDDVYPHYTQCVNRVGSEGSYTLMGIAVAVIVTIAVASTVMRVKHLASVQARETIQASTASAPASGNPFGNGGTLPDAVTAPQQAADAKAQEDVRDSDRMEGMSAFVMLAFIFVVTQAVGIIAGYKWGFAGKNSIDAYRGTLGFSTYDDYLRYFSPILAKAEAKLTTLQQRLAEQHANIGLGLKNTFENFLLERPGRPGEAVAQANATSARLTPEDVVARIDGFGSDREGAKRYLMALDPALRAEVAPLLKARKEARAAEEKVAHEQALAKEVEDLL